MTVLPEGMRSDSRRAAADCQLVPVVGSVRIAAVASSQRPRLLGRVSLSQRAAMIEAVSDV
jgi:hypothetical protein